ncbi:hypothetical protein D477_019348 [Arthrobacter crystallopoietes BAB-32]|uniref:DUF4439 domain-containing protein n=1 Tax=Arthrobacter crystallopoietes BAB-32 TaxID=1246476 RepID=N1UQD3_9MICC|nr:DUF4439 domain-containing protein [Arthrobacter crystallopoietes]EMY32596.1 hypothetical protein D477_019348 [Arthrobacter crystallopoietes BAB-32]
MSAVLASEYRMSFVYEATLPRLDGGLQRQASAFYAEHRALMARWEELAAAHCLDLPLRQPAYPLPGDVVAEPRQALAAAEADAARALGDLVAFGDDGLQQAAAAELAGSAVRLAVLAGEPALTPGLEAAEGGPGPTAAAKASGWALP